MGKKNRKMGSSVLGKKSTRFTGPSPEEIADIQRIQEEKEEESKRLIEKGGTLKVPMPRAHGEPEHKAKIISPSDIDKTIGKEKKKKARKYEVKIEEEQ